MNDDKNFSMKERRAEGGEVDRPRRKFLLWLPAAVFASIGATLAASALRFLRPRASPAGETGWISLMAVAELEGARPLLRGVVIERVAGWSRERDTRTLYVLPGQALRVVSAVCPHEECVVEWLDEARRFQCPCHDSSFDAEGRLVDGPAPRGLDELPARIENGVLQIQLGDGAPAASVRGGTSSA